jgi:hypothetical protein
MHLYLTQLIEDLESVANNPPPAPFIEPPPHMADNLIMAELALTPYKSIAEWTGIGAEVFPDMTDLAGGQWESVNEVIFRVFGALRLDLVDLPPDMPPEILYEVLTSNWDHPVQYLPSSGMDLELCTGDPQTCPYGDYCDHSLNPDEQSPEFFDGIYNDDGTKADLTSVPIPGLCLICKSYQINDWDENLLCMMNRHDQKDDSDFKCGAFEKI